MMDKLSFLLFFVVATTLMGIFVLVVLIVPELSNNENSMIPVAAGLGFIVSLPLSFWVSKKLKDLVK